MSKDIDMTPPNRHVLLTKAQADLIRAAMTYSSAPDSEAIIAQLDQAFTIDEREASIIDLATMLAGDDGISFDDFPLVSEGDDNGAYVMGWVWAPFEGTGLDKEAEPEEEEPEDE